MTDNNDENRYKLADAMIIDMSPEDIHIFITDSLMSQYEDHPEYFDEDWKIQFGADKYE